MSKTIKRLETEAKNLLLEARSCLDKITDNTPESESNRLVAQHDELMKRFDTVDKKLELEKEIKGRFEPISVTNRGSDVEPYLTEIIAAGVENRALKGLAAEMQQEHRDTELSQHGGIFVPFEQLEQRADNSTLSSELTGVNPLMIASPLQRLYETGIARQCGFTMLTPSRGKVSVPRISSATTLTWATEGNSVDATEADTANVEFAPTLGTANHLFTKVALSQMTPAVEASFRADLVNLTQSAIDNLAVQALEDSVTANDDSGTTLTHKRTLADAIALNDGVHANRLNQIRLVMRPECLGYLATTVFDSGSGLVVLDKLSRQTAGVLSTAHLDYTANSNKSNVVSIAAGVPGGVGRIAIWGGGISVIVDPYSKSHAGMVRVTVQVLAAAKVVRTSAVKVTKLKHAT